MQILDRYILIRVLQPFLYCVLGFVSIWLVFDLSENAPTFLENKAPLSRVAQFYFLRVPEIILMSLPVGLLLAILYTFTQMSRRNEIISILGSGRSVLRLLAPLLILGLALTAFATALNYSAAPHAGAVKTSCRRSPAAPTSNAKPSAVTSSATAKTAASGILPASIPRSNASRRS